MKFLRTAIVFLAVVAPALACPNCKQSLAGNEMDGWFMSIVGMVLSPFVIGGGAALYIARYGKKTRSRVPSAESGSGR
jgi:hypothetical protein